jgi:hypothetical protein
LRPKAEEFDIEDSSSTTPLRQRRFRRAHHSWTHKAFRGERDAHRQRLRFTLELDSHLHGYVWRARKSTKRLPRPTRRLLAPLRRNALLLEALRTRDFSTLLSPIADATQSLATVLAMNESIDSGAPVDVR